MGRCNYSGFGKQCNFLRWTDLPNFGHVTTVPPTIGPFSDPRHLPQTTSYMAAESTKAKDTLKVEKTSLLVLSLCILVLVSILIWHPF